MGKLYKDSHGTMCNCLMPTTTSLIGGDSNYSSGTPECGCTEIKTHYTPFCPMKYKYVQYIVSPQKAWHHSNQGAFL